MAKMIYVLSSDCEAEEFVEWLNENGHQAQLTNDEPDCEYNDKELVNQLWENYCNQ